MTDKEKASCSLQINSSLNSGFLKGRLGPNNSKRALAGWKAFQTCFFRSEKWWLYRKFVFLTSDVPLYGNANAKCQIIWHLHKLEWCYMIPCYNANICSEITVKTQVKTVKLNYVQFFYCNMYYVFTIHSRMQKCRFKCTVITLHLEQQSNVKKYS